MLYAASFLVSAIGFSFLARGEPEPWARDDIHDKPINNDHDAQKELIETNSKNSIV
jgi:hypothetical protein